MSTVDMDTFKQRAAELVEKAMTGEPVVIEHHGKHAVILPCEGPIPDFEAFPQLDLILKERASEPGVEVSPDFWESIRNRK